jgi:hypothetical protein
MSKLTDQLKALGDTPNAVAARLLQEGCFGYRRNPCGCPMFYWLYTHGYQNIAADGVQPWGVQSRDVLEVLRVAGVAKSPIRKPRSDG